MICLAMRSSISSIVARGVDRHRRRPRPGTLAGEWRSSDDGPGLPAASEPGGRSLPTAARPRTPSSSGGCARRSSSSPRRVLVVAGSRSFASLGRPADVYSLPSAPTRPGRLGIWWASINCLRILATSSRLTASSSAIRRSDQSWCSFSLTSTARRRSARVSGRPWNRLTLDDEVEGIGERARADLGRDRPLAQHDRRGMAVETVGEQQAAVDLVDRDRRQPIPGVGVALDREIVQPVAEIEIGVEDEVV